MRPGRIVSSQHRRRHLTAPRAALALLVGLAACQGQPGEPPAGDFPAAPTRPGRPGTPTPEPGPGPAAGAPPAAISGGTLALSRDGGTAAVAEPDSDRVFLVDLKTRVVRATLALNPGDEPGRVVADGEGRFHVALRRGGAVVTINAQAGQISERRPVCATPRGLAVDDFNGRLHVACQSGELVTLATGGGAPLRTLRLGFDDLRDVLLVGDRLYVSRFRSAEVLVVAPDGAVAGTLKAPDAAGATIDPRGQMLVTKNEPAVAWRLAGLPDGRVLLLHQRAQVDPITPGKGGYGGGGRCPGGIVQSVLTSFAPGQAAPLLGSPQLPTAVLPVDVAVSRDGVNVTVVAAGATGGRALPLLTYRSDALAPAGGCMPVPSTPAPVSGAVAAAYDDAGALWVQTRAPYGLVSVNAGGAQTAVISLASGGSHRGHDLFHQSTTAFLACASCHPEGGEDGRVWTFNGVGPRRSQSLRGGIVKTAPFHWDGDQANFSALMTDVFLGRMGGPLQGGFSVTDGEAMASFVDAIPALPRPAPADAAAVARGKALFEDAVVGCAGCHSGALFTNNQRSDVGTSGGRAFQVPQLVNIAARVPLMHDGCARTLHERFTVSSCGGGDRHGVTSQLSPGQIDDLVTYLKTL